MVHLILAVRWNLPVALCKAAFEDLQMLVFNFFWTEHTEDDFMPPVIVEPTGLDAILGRSYVPHQRPPHVFDGPPHLHLLPDAIRISKLTHVSKEVHHRFALALHQLASRHRKFFVDERTFGPETPVHIRTYLQDKPRLYDAVNDFLSERGMTEDWEMCAPASVVLSDPADGGMLTLDQHEKMVRRGRL